MHYYEVHCGLGKCGFSRFFKNKKKLYGENAIVTALIQLDYGTPNPFDTDDAREVNYAKEISKEDFDKTKV